MSLATSRDRLLRATLRLLWGQWTELGVAGVRGSSSAVIDPEALLLAIAVFGRYEPRLFDETLDWLARTSDQLDVTRLRRVSKKMSIGQDRLVGTLVDFMRARSSANKWSGAAESILAREDQASWSAQALFMRSDGQPLPTFGTADTFFGAHGFERPALELRGMSSAPDLTRPALARLRMRALAGQGVRAEVLLYLATHDGAHGRLVAERSAYSQRQVAEYLTLLAASGLVESWGDGRKLQYRLAAPTVGLRVRDVAYVDWVSGFGVLMRLWLAIREAAGQPDRYEASTRLRSVFDALREIPPAEGLGLPLPEPSRHPGEQLVGYVEEYCDLVSAVLEGM
jgi:hypothetical protein